MPTIARHPPERDRSGSSISFSGSTSRRKPKPEQVGQAPCGELKLKSRGEISLSEKPQLGHAWRADNTISSPPGPDRQRQTLTDPEGGLEGIGETGRHTVADRQTVDHHLDRVFSLLVELGRFSGLDDLAIDPRANKALAHHLRKDLAVLALATLDHRREQHESGAVRQGRGADRPSARRSAVESESHNRDTSGTPMEAHRRRR